MASATPHEQLRYDRRLLGAEVRLLIISPSPDALLPLECRLQHADLDAAPSYEALSYVWGNPNERHEFQCDDVTISSTSSLYTALLRLRLADDARTIWADAICINQEDLDERAHQVTLMGRIYSQAESVVVWLGSDDVENNASTAAVALQSVFDACMALEARWKKLPRDLESRRPFFQENFTEPESDYLIRTPIFHTSESIYEETSVGWHFYRCVPPPKELDTAAWVSLKALYDRTWFQRTWCVQEVRLSKRVICYWAHQELSWSHIGTVAAWLQDIHSRHDYGPNTFPVEIDYESAERMYDTEWVEKSLMETLRDYRSLQATDPRDKVYGVLNLVEKGPLRASTVIDYKKSVDKVYADTALQIIRASSNLTILAVVDHDVDFTGEFARYTWAPRWNEDNRPMPLIDHDEDRIAAAGTTGPIELDSDHLTLEGIPLGKVVSIDMVLDDIKMKDKAAPDIRNPILTLWNKVMGSKKYSYNDVEWMCTSLEMAETLTTGDGFSDLELGIGEAAAVRRWHLWDSFIAMIEHLFEVTGQENTTDYKMHIISNDGGERSRYEALMWRACDQRRIIWLDNHCYGLGPACIREGDYAVLLAGGQTPFALRQTEDGYIFLGSVYIQKVVDEGLIERLRDGNKELRNYRLM